MSTEIYSLIIGIVIPIPWLVYKIRKQRQEDKELKWFNSLPYSDQDKIVTPSVTSDEILKSKIKILYKMRGEKQ